MYMIFFLTLLAVKTLLFEKGAIAIPFIMSLAFVKSPPCFTVVDRQSCFSHTLSFFPLH